MLTLKASIRDRIYLTYPSKMEKHPFFDILKEENEHENPKYFLLRKMRKRWIKEPKHLVLWEVIEKKQRYLALPRGCEMSIRKLAREESIQLEWKDKTIYPELYEEIPKPVVKLDRFQRIAVSELLKYQNGCLASPTGSGKTLMLLSVVRQLQTPTLILVHTKELLRQTAQRCQEWLEIEAGIIGDGIYEERPVTVAMIQTLGKMDLQDSDFANRYGAVLVDEVHHSPALSWSRILNALPARYKYGFTATAWRKDHLEFIIWKVIGKIRWEVKRQEAEDAGRIMRPTIEQVDTNFEYELLDLSEWGKMISALINNEDRNNLIARTVEQKIHSSSRALILTDRIQHAIYLSTLLEKYNPVLLVGSMDRQSRQSAIRQVRDGAKLTIATIHLLGEGVDVPGWDLLFLVSPFARGPRVLQALGRIARVSFGKSSATLVDFIDVNIPKLVKAANARKKLYAGE